GERQKGEEVALEAEGRRQFDRRKQKSSVTGNRHHFLSGTDQASSNRPGQTDTKCLLPVGDEHLSSAKTIKMAGEPNVKRAHVQTERHIVAQKILQLVHQANLMYGKPVKPFRTFGEFPPVASNIVEKLRICRGVLRFYLIR